MLIKGLASVKPAEYGSNRTISAPMAGRLFAQTVGGRGAEGGVLEYHRHLRLVAHQLGHLQLRLGELRRARERREGIVATLVELVGARAGQQRHFRALGDLARDQRQRAGKAAVNRRQLVAGDQAIGLGARDGRIALHVGDDQVQLGAAQGLDAAGIVDHLDRELGGVDAALADLREAAGDRVESPDIHGLRRPGRARDAECRERARGERTARGPGEKISAAVLPCR